MAKGKKNCYFINSNVLTYSLNRCLQCASFPFYRVVELMPEESEDMWHVYNLIAVSDNVRASTVR